MLTQHSTGHDWVTASAADKAFYVSGACGACAQTKGLHESVPEIVVEGIDALFAIPSLRRHKLSFAFGEIHTAQIFLGEYHALVDSFRIGEQEGGRL